MNKCESIVSKIDNEQLTKTIEGSTIELDDLGVDDADGFKLTKTKFTQSVWSKTNITSVLDLQVGDARTEALIVQQFAASV